MIRKSKTFCSRMSGGSNKTLEYFQLLGSKRMQKLFQIFRIDFEMFDYSIDSYEQLYLWLFFHIKSMNIVKQKTTGIDFRFIFRFHIIYYLKAKWNLFPADPIHFKLVNLYIISLLVFNWHLSVRFHWSEPPPSPLYGAKRFERRKLRRA